MYVHVQYAHVASSGHCVFDHESFQRNAQSKLCMYVCMYVRVYTRSSLLGGRS